jgi:hypothetical protein
MLRNPNDQAQEFTLGLANVSASSALPTARASEFSSLMLLCGSNALPALCSQINARHRRALEAGAT